MFARKVLIATAFSLLVMSTTTMALPKPVKAKAPPAKHDPLVEAQLRISFGKADLDKDGFLNDAELARSFRGPNAKPAPVAAFDEKGNLPNPSALKYPDQIYLLALDTDRDGKVSWAEFDAYGEAQASQLKNLQKVNQESLRAAYALAQRQLATQRNQNYSRYGRTNYHRAPASHRGPPRSFSASRAQIQRAQQHRVRTNYSPNAQRQHRPVIRHPFGIRR